ncbi:MAG: hypothetical protein RMK29_14225 [Myxococcales bacterium]|nr:hypothetical protein [Myxococcales bacterium]
MGNGATVDTFFLLGLLAGLVATGHLWWRGRRSPSPRPQRGASPTPPVSRLRPGDIVQHHGEDFLVEEVVLLAESGRSALLGRLRGQRYLWVRPPDGAIPREPLWILEEARSPIELGEAEELWHGLLRYRLSRRYPVEMALAWPAGETSAALRAVERVLEYRGIGAARALLLCGAEGTLALAGEAVPEDRVAILPGSFWQPMA